MDRILKRLIIALIFLLVIGGIGYGAKVLFFGEERPTCFDNVQNGQEEGVDCGLIACGLICEPEILPVQILSSKFFRAGSGDYDLVTLVSNRNSSYGASLVAYDLVFTNQAGDELLRRPGAFYILPGQTKFIVLTSLNIESEPADISIEIKNAQWEKLEPSDTAISFPIRGKSYSVLNQDNIFSEFEGLVFNDSDFDFDKVDVGIILFDDASNIIGVNKTDIRTFISNTERGFKVRWPFSFEGDVIRVDIEISTNLFENSNFIKRYGTQEKFQKFY